MEQAQPRLVRKDRQPSRTMTALGPWTARVYVEVTVMEEFKTFDEFISSKKTTWSIARELGIDEDSVPGSGFVYLDTYWIRKDGPGRGAYYVRIGPHEFTGHIHDLESRLYAWVAATNEWF